MRLTLSFAALAANLAVMAAPALANTRVCRFVETDARVGYPPNLVVSLSENQAEGLCRISVAGVAPDETSRSVSSEDRRALLDAARHGDVQPSALGAAVFAFFGAASPTNDDAPDPDPQLAGGVLAGCFAMAREAAEGFVFDEEFGVSGLDDIGLRCAVANDADAAVPLSDFLETPVVLQAPTLALARDRDDGWAERLLVPIPER